MEEQLARWIAEDLSSREAQISEVAMIARPLGVGWAVLATDVGGRRTVICSREDFRALTRHLEGMVQA